MELTLEHITKHYNKGKVLALNDFTTTLTPGVYGLLGPNGAGKTTLMNIITDNIKPDSGNITYNGESIWDLGKNYRFHLGYMPQQQGLYDQFTANRFLWYMASLKGLAKEDAKKQINELIDLVNLRNEIHMKLKSFSGGMKQRLLIAQALLGNPNIIILDEPTAGLDPKERIRIRNFISQVGKEKIVLLATHVVPDVEFIAKEIIILKKGQLIKHDSPSNLLKLMEEKVFELMIQEDDFEMLQASYKISNLYRESTSVIARIVTDEAPTNWSFRKANPTLEDLYLYLFQ